MSLGFEDLCEQNYYSQVLFFGRYNQSFISPCLVLTRVVKSSFDLCSKI